MLRTATISNCERFRYSLGRRWGSGFPLLFVMLNPSIADAEVDDATIRRCISFATAHSFAAIEVVNLFAFRATKPRDLALAGWLPGPDNDYHIGVSVIAAGAVCVAWGAHAAHHRVDERVQHVLPLIRKLGHQPQCLRITRSGHPQHPLMLPSNCRLQPFDMTAIEEAMHT
jgi:hypothetical protein